MATATEHEPQEDSFPIDLSRLDLGELKKDNIPNKIGGLINELFTFGVDYLNFLSNNLDIALNMIDTSEIGRGSRFRIGTSTLHPENMVDFPDFPCGLKDRETLQRQPVIIQQVLSKIANIFTDSKVFKRKLTEAWEADFSSEAILDEKELQFLEWLLVQIRNDMQIEEINVTNNGRSLTLILVDDLVPNILAHLIGREYARTNSKQNSEP